MSEYRVIWEIDLEADTPQEAAEKALKVHRNPESIATVFDVQDTFTGEIITIDLSEGDPEIG